MFRSSQEGNVDLVVDLNQIYLILKFMVLITHFVYHSWKLITSG